MVIKHYAGECMDGAKSKQTRERERESGRKERRRGGKEGGRQEGRRHRKNWGLSIMPVLALLNSKKRNIFHTVCSPRYT